MKIISKSTRELYYNARLELINLYYRLLLIRQLFTSQDNVDLLDKVAYRFFRLLRDDLIDTIVMATSRLIDPSKIHKYENASLQKIIDSLDPIQDLDLINGLTNILEQIKTKTSRIEDWRDKWISHRDYDVIQGNRAKPATSLTEIEDILHLFGQFLNEFERVWEDQLEININEVSVEEANEILRLKIFTPNPYEDWTFSVDGNTILELLGKANIKRT